MDGIKSRASEMVALYGEVCTIRQAQRILHCGYSKIKTMMDDGRLSAACQGTKVDVRSIAEYIMAPAQKNEEARIRKIRIKRNTNFCV